MHKFATSLVLLISVCNFCFCDEFLKVFPGQTRVLLRTGITHNGKTVQCSSKDAEIEAHVIRELTDRFRDRGDPNPSTMKIYAEKRECASSLILNLRLIFDEYQLSRSAVYVGTKNIKKMVHKLLESSPPFEYQFKNPEVKDAQYGTASMPIEFEAELSITITERKKYMQCYGTDCMATENDICEQMFDYVIGPSKIFSQYYTGCNVRQFYFVGKVVKVGFSLLFNHRAALCAHAFLNVTEIEVMIQEAMRSGKLPTIVTNIKVTSIIHIDHTEIWAASPTTIPFSPTLYNPFSEMYLWYSQEIKRLLIQNIVQGSIISPTCFVRAAELLFDECEKVATVGVRLMFSRQCLFKHKIWNGFMASAFLTRSWQIGNSRNYLSLAPSFHFFEINSKITDSMEMLIPA